MRAVIVAHGDALEADRGCCGGADLLIAADGGMLTLARWGITPQVLVGDLDSIDPGEAARLAARGVEVVPFAKEKDESDTELALDLAVERGATSAVLVGAMGSRLDHTLANLLLIADPAFRDVAVRAVRGSTSVRALHAGRTLTIDRRPGVIVTLLPVEADAQGVRTAGLKYRLDGETLRFGRSRGLSNVVVASGASVSLDTGVLLVIETEEE